MNNKIRTLIIENDLIIVENLKKYFSSSAVIDIIGIASNGLDALEKMKLEHNEIDLVIMDPLLTKIDGLKLLQEFSKMKLNCKIILTCSVKSNFIFNNVEKLNIDYIMLKPYNFDNLTSVILNVFEKVEYFHQNINLENRITKMLHTLGIPSHIKGYQYIREGVLLIYNNPYIIGGITKELYPTVANKFKTTASRVERAIRHAIEVSWNRGDYEYMEELFGHSVDYDRAKPTNSEFIATVADKLKLEIRNLTR